MGFLALVVALYVPTQILLAKYLPAGNGGMIQGVILFLAAILATERIAGAAPESRRFAIGAIAFFVIAAGLFVIGLFAECRWSPNGCGL
jgi:hypothetical protein